MAVNEKAQTLSEEEIQKRLDAGEDMETILESDKPDGSSQVQLESTLMSGKNSEEESKSKVNNTSEKNSDKKKD